MKRIALLASLILLPFTSIAEEITGEPKLVDNKTIEIDGQLIRFWGLDAPDLDQICYTSGKRQQPFRCGAATFEKIGKMLQNQTLTCKGDKRDADGRLIAICYSHMGNLEIEVNEQLALSGWAVADPSEGKHYLRFQNVAQRLKDGLWRSSFVMPWEWRAGNHEPPPIKD
jgi:endonuclease YncB( thermonuclease family)